MNGSPAKMGTISGTAGHSSALKMKAEADAASALKQKGTYAGAKKSDPKLDEYINTRSSSKKGSAEYDAAQNKINVAYGNKTRHGQTNETTVSKSGKKQTSVKTTPGVATTTTKVKPRVLGGSKTTKETVRNDGTTAKTVIKKDKEGDTRRAKTIIKDAPAGSGGTYDKKIKTKYDKDGVATKEKQVIKSEHVGKTKVKKNFKKDTKKVVNRKDGRRTVTKTDAGGNVTTKSRRTLGGWLTGKGKGKRTKTVTPAEEK